ncbi:MAG: TatD family hydrolase [Spirochaetes bacterium]|nr:TatD family hydrolase [Spirochaetota bacterium]
MKLVDAHCHLEDDVFAGRLDDIISGARNAGIVKLITCSITPGQWPLSKSISEQFAEVEFAMGVHPWYCRREDLADLEDLLRARELGAVAIGEIGLDLKVTGMDFGLQIEIFEKQLSIAREIDLPVIMHCRGAFNELILSMKKIGVPASGGIIHSFSGSPELAEELGKWNLSFSMGGTLTYRNSRKRERLLRLIYPGRFLLETDSPDIPPVEKSGEPNVPSNILYNLRAASEILGEPEEKIADRTSENAARIFKLAI